MAARRKPSSGRVAHGHARSILKRMGAVALHEARSSPIHRAGRMMNLRVDLFGCLDMLALMPDGRLVGVQVTTWTGGGHASARRRKVQEALIDPVRGQRPQLELWVWAWVARTHMRRWIWVPPPMRAWRELEPVADREGAV